MSNVKILVRLIAVPVLFFGDSFVGAIVGAILLVALAAPAQAQRFESPYPRPLTSYTLYATGQSLGDSVTIGHRSGIPGGTGGFALLRLVSPLSFFFTIGVSTSANFTASVSSHFLPANVVGFFRVPWGSWLAAMTPTVISNDTGAVNTSGRAIIYITEME